MRNKYKVTFHYPVMVEGVCKYTTSKSYLFKTYAIAKLTHIVTSFYCKLINSKYYSSRMGYIPKYIIDTDLSVDWADSGRWRSYNLTTSGDTFQELLDNATVSEVDQDGGELDCYGLYESNTDVLEESLELIKDKVYSK